MWMMMMMMLGLGAHCTIEKTNEDRRRHESPKETCTHNFRMFFSRNSDESKSRRGFGSLLRRHTSFNAPEANGGAPAKNGHGAAPLMTSPQDFHEY